MPLAVLRPETLQDSCAMKQIEISRPISLLLVDNNAADVRCAQEALRDGKIQNEMQIVADGQEALRYLRHEGSYSESQVPDLILLEINLPGMDGLELLDELQKDQALRKIPVAILTSSRVEQRVLKTYKLPAACFLTKPLDVDRYLDAVRCFAQFGLTIVALASA